MADQPTACRLIPLWDQRRGGTEPLVALVSVAAICVAVSVYAGFASVTIGTATDGGAEVEQATLDVTWQTLAEDGVINTETHRLATALGPETLPRGHLIHASITIVGEDGRRQPIDSASFDEEARRAPAADPPASAAVAERPVAVRLDGADVRPGRLRVVVWDA